MHMRRVPCQEYPPDAIAIDHTYGWLIDRAPRDALDVMTGEPAHHALDARLRGLYLRGELEQRRVRQRTKRDHAAPSEGPEMPIAAIQSLDLDIRNDHRLFVD